ncbi:hypothetical protein [Winogradskyella bathintestinalis]|uniref:DUF4179 domain-containing protein n=1 Tax=Winogradskyella bathintestinalis TaxID=3035208 RepID=A0ABT7ZT15_9FLAO|nr:hypothetical protein [Winogradskyella bathintestinalis]MDN3492101.1 hypothetical protein [Winogradskyella bathintestinalis]
MNKDKFDHLFDDLKDQFDTETLQEHHEQRFLQKLNEVDMASNGVIRQSPFNWKPLLAVAAAIIICISVFTTLQYQPETLDLASISPEMSETQDFFTVTIENELKKLNKERSPLTEQIISDALEQIGILETDYKKLKSALTESGKNQRVIYAMISNFQNRIDILNTVLEQIEVVKQIKINENETKFTI